MAEPRTIVVVGHGMVGARFAEEVARRDPDGRRVRVQVLGAEPEGPYNRILLSESVNGGLRPEELALPPLSAACLAARSGVSATGIDRAARRVTLDDGTALGYDELVLATGARPAFPPLPGLRDAEGRPAEGVTALRDLADCRRVRSWARPGAPLVVLGGGVLGLEAARGLNEAGARVAVVESAPWIMRRQLDKPAARILADSLRAGGVQVHSWRVASRWIPGSGLELDDGTVVAGDGLIVTAGVRARTELAEQAGIACEHGIVVDERLSTSDPRVHAVGDCAQAPGGGAGLVAPGWEMARVLADLLTGTDPAARYTGARAVTRLKAEGIELTAMGEAEADDDKDVETVAVSDPHGGRYAKLSVRGGRVAGAVLLGFPDSAAAIAQLFADGAEVPPDRLALLLGGAQPASAPALPPERVTVCHCNAVTRGDLESAWLDGARTKDDVAAKTRATTGCGGCTRDVNALLTSMGAAGTAVAAPSSVMIQKFV